MRSFSHGHSLSHWAMHLQFTLLYSLKYSTSSLSYTLPLSTRLSSGDEPFESSECVSSFSTKFGLLRFQSACRSGYLAFQAHEPSEACLVAYQYSQSCIKWGNLAQRWVRWVPIHHNFGLVWKGVSLHQVQVADFRPQLQANHQCKKSTKIILDGLI